MKLKDVIEELDNKILETEIGDDYEAEGGGSSLSIFDKENARSVELKIEPYYIVDKECTYYHKEVADDGKVKYTTSKETDYYKRKEDALKYFREQIPSMANYCTSFIGWNNESVVLSIYDYDDYHFILHKWKGFDNDVEIGWEYKGNLFHSYEELWEAYPIFDGQRMYCDRPWIYSKDDKEVAELAIYTRWDNPEHFKPKTEFAASITINDDDIPF